MPDTVEHLKEIMDERDRLYEERFLANDRRSVERFERMTHETGLRFEAADKALLKVDTATEKRFDSVNEFRLQLKDQAATLISREEANTRLHALEEKIEDLKKTGIQKNQFDLRTVLTIISMVVAIAAVFLKTR